MIDLSVTFAQELGGAARGSTEEDDPLSVRSLAWLVQAAQAKLSAQRDREAETEHRLEGLGRFPDEWAAEHGALTEEEMARASRERLPRRRGTRPW